MTTTENPTTPALSPRKAVLHELAEAIKDKERAEERVKLAYQATEAEETYVAVRELADYLNHYPGITPTDFPSWGRRRATACGRPQRRKRLR